MPEQKRCSKEDEKMLYEVKLKQGYFEATFTFGYNKDALKFMDWAKMHHDTHDEDGNPVELKVLMEIKGCAEGGNPEMAHTKEQLESNTDSGDCQ